MSKPIVALLLSRGWSGFAESAGALARSPGRSGAATLPTSVAMRNEWQRYGAPLSSAAG